VSKHVLEFPAPSFEDVVAAPAPAARPANATRSLFHIGSGAFALLMLRVMPSRAWLVAASGAFFVAAWTMEISRRKSPAVNERLMRFFSPIAHAGERHAVNSGTWFITALVLMAIFAPLRAAEVGVVVLALADPAAGLIGRKFGRIRLRARRSLEGTLAFLFAGALAALVTLTAFHAVPLPARILIALAAAAAGAIAELGTTRLDDNFTIPLTAASAAALAELALRLG
jgi:dolichol kinase